MTGAGPARLVAVPGLGLSTAVPRHFLDRLPAAISSAVVELPGFGRPASRGARLDPTELARLLLRRLDELGPGPAVLLGHSASCQIVAEAAAAAPHRVSALVLVGPTTDPRARTWPALAGRWVRTAGHERPGQVPRLLHDYGRTGLRSMRRGMDAARKHRIGPALAGVRCPVLVVRGPRDRIAPQDWTDQLAGLVGDGRSVTLAAGAHMVPITHPALLAAAVQAFLERTGASVR